MRAAGAAAATTGFHPPVPPPALVGIPYLNVGEERIPKGSKEGLLISNNNDRAAGVRASWTRSNGAAEVVAQAAMQCCQEQQEGSQHACHEQSRSLR